MLPNAPPPSEALLEVQHLKMHYPVYQGVFRRKVAEVKSVDGVSLRVGRSETLGIVGESGSGKTTVAKCIVRLLVPTAGRILFKGDDLCQVGESRLRHLRRHVQMIFQDPYLSLSPFMKVGDIVVEPLKVQGILRDSKRLKAEAERSLELVRLSPNKACRYPHELSGGQRQRIAIARALVLKPNLIICDEPISALDVFTQSKILDLLLELQEEFSLSYLFISHDVAAVRFVSDRIGVMYLGQLVELAESEELCANPLHPYTRALVSAVPFADPFLEISRQRIVVQGEIASPLHPPSGCRFHPRCWQRVPEKCDREEPQDVDTGGGHFVRCHQYSS
ncbi:MAG: ABC transporter ATP-binding protein [Chloroflexi bacterium]|nr:ABC transporter ATP-binding protein [Chloroflexota bacterium]